MAAGRQYWRRQLLGRRAREQGRSRLSTRPASRGAKPAGNDGTLIVGQHFKRYCKQQPTPVEGAAIYQHDGEVEMAPDRDCVAWYKDVVNKPESRAPDDWGPLPRPWCSARGRSGRREIEAGSGTFLGWQRRAVRGHPVRACAWDSHSGASGANRAPPSSAASSGAGAGAPSQPWIKAYRTLRRIWLPPTLCPTGKGLALLQSATSSRSTPNVARSGGRIPSGGREGPRSAGAWCGLVPCAGRVRRRDCRWSRHQQRA